MTHRARERKNYCPYCRGFTPHEIRGYTDALCKTCKRKHKIFNIKNLIN